MTTSQPPVDRLSQTALQVCVAALGATAWISLICGPQIAGDRLPMQWGLDGAPTWFGPRAYSLWGLVVATAAVGATLALVGRLSRQAGRTIWWTLIFVSCVMTAAQAFHAFKLMRWSGQ